MSAERIAELEDRIERAAEILTQAPDLNLKDYSKTQAKKLANDMLIAWAILTEGVYPESQHRQEAAS